MDRRLFALSLGFVGLILATRHGFAADVSGGHQAGCSPVQTSCTEISNSAQVTS